MRQLFLSVDGRQRGTCLAACAQVRPVFTLALCEVKPRPDYGLAPAADGFMNQHQRPSLTFMHATSSSVLILALQSKTIEVCRLTSSNAGCKSPKAGRRRIASAPEPVRLVCPVGLSASESAGSICLCSVRRRVRVRVENDLVRY